ncbi:uncharacterized protein LOC111689169 [Lucilia cuprina]|uniref:uncharacterized protein LOC111689169 n=1 Tax=Lucilia cuprina TaxID=7375 RepID=UPI001F060B48|nr:uncharacterized protein LOC111689169 [Lucilia cuprina]
MSFFRNLRSSITRGRSSSRDTTPVRNSRPGSVISSLNSGSGKRRDSIESRSDSLFNRSETFILDEPDITPCHSNCSTLEKKSKKSKVLEKFSTFTKRKKTPATETAAFEHHPSDNATNTYYKWQADGVNSLDYDSQNDPFNFLYEQQSSLKSLHNNSSSSQADSLKSTSSPSTTNFDSSTYRKSKMPNDLKKQLKLLKDQDLNNKENDVKKIKEPLALQERENEEEEEDHKADKYKTVTLNSFRKSFREKFLQQQKEAAYNPAWFVQVENPELNKNKLQQRENSKENRRDLLVFENDNYRPGSRSPIRDLNNRKAVRSPTRSPVKRNETFKVERLSRLDKQNLKTKPDDSTPSIRIEFKNSITPHIPGRMVPVGVAKPMPSQLSNTQYYQKTETTPMNTSYTIKSSVGNTTTTRLNNHSPIRSPWLKEQSPSRNIINNTTTRPGRYQTLVQIKNEKTRQASPVTVRNSRLSTRIQLSSNGPSNSERKNNLRSVSPTFGKRYNNSHLLGTSNTGSKAQPLKQTYFGDTPQTAKIIQTTPSSQLNSSTNGLRTTRIVGTPAYGNYKYQHTPSSSLFSSATTLTPSTSSRSTPSYSVNNIHSSSHNNLSYLKHYQLQQTPPQQRKQQQQHQHQSRIMVAGQRRSRSPIKIPWR